MAAKVERGRGHGSLPGQSAVSGFDKASLGIRGGAQANGQSGHSSLLSMSARNASWSASREVNAMGVGPPDVPMISLPPFVVVTRDTVAVHHGRQSAFERMPAAGDRGGQTPRHDLEERRGSDHGAGPLERGGLHVVIDDNGAERSRSRHRPPDTWRLARTDAGGRRSSRAVEEDDLLRSFGVEHGLPENDVPAGQAALAACLEPCRHIRVPPAGDAPHA